MPTDGFFPASVSKTLPSLVVAMAARSVMSLIGTLVSHWSWAASRYTIRFRSVTASSSGFGDWQIPPGCMWRRLLPPFNIFTWFPRTSEYLHPTILSPPWLPENLCSWSTFLRMVLIWFCSLPVELIRPEFFPNTLTWLSWESPTLILARTGSDWYKWLLWIAPLQ